MFRPKEGINILSNIGGVKTAEEAEKVFRESQ